MKKLFRGWSWEHWYNLAREDIDEAFASVARAGRYALYTGLCLWVLSGFHIVRQDEVGITTICGAASRGVENPGLRYRLPWPMGTVTKIPLQRQQRLTIGIKGDGLTQAQRLGLVKRGALDDTVARQFDQDAETKESQLEKTIREGQAKQLNEDVKALLGDGLPLLTADHNMIMVMAVVQYNIKNAKDYIYRSEGSALILNRAATAALLQEAAVRSVDDILTTARSEVEAAVRTKANAMIAAYNTGVEVAGVSLQKVAPPEDVAASFRTVNTAREERNTIVNQANEYQNTLLPEAEGEASRLIAEAEGFKSSRVAEARGEASRFQGVLREFQLSGSLTAERLRLETLERTLSRATKVQVGGRPDSPVDVVVMPDAPRGE